MFVCVKCSNDSVTVIICECVASHRAYSPGCAVQFVAKQLGHKKAFSSNFIMKLFINWMSYL